MILSIAMLSHSHSKTAHHSPKIGTILSQAKIMATAIGEIVRNGILFDVKNWNHEMTPSDDFVQNIDRLFNALEERNINYLLVGGVALLSYVEGRNTQDIDLILSQSELEALPEIIDCDRNQNFIRGQLNQLQIDIWLTQNALFQKMTQDYVTSRQFGDRKIRCVTVEGLVILKFYALPSLYRQGQFDRASIDENDILLLLLKYPVDLDATFRLLSNHLLPSDVRKIQAIAAEIDAKIKRFAIQKKQLEEDP